MSRTFALGLAIVVAIGASPVLAPSAKAFHGGSSGSHGGFFGGSHGGSFGGLFHGSHGSSGGYGSHGGNGNSCDCDCNGSDEAVEGDHADNDKHADRGDRVMVAPSRDGYRESREVKVYERDRNGRRVESRVTRESNKDDRNHKDADHKRNGDQKDKEVKQGDKDANKDKNKETDSDKEKKNNEK